MTLTVRGVVRILAALAMMIVGVMHFIDPERFVRIVPEALPAKTALVLVSGFFEVLGGAGLLIPYTRRAASFGLVALYIAVFPANINMAIHNIQMGDSPMPPALLWLRLPFQILFILLALWVGKDDTPARGAKSA